MPPDCDQPPLSADRRRAVLLAAAVLEGVALPCLRTRTAFADLMAAPDVQAMARDLRRIDPARADALRVACRRRRDELNASQSAGR